MAFEWIDSLLNGNKQTKEANITPQGTNRDDHFAKKIEANDWIKGVSELDADKVEAEYLAAQAAEARALGKTAAHEFKSDEEVLKADKERATKILSDYALAEMLAELRCSKEQNTQEMFHEAKEKAKKEVASSREKAEKALMDMIPENTHLDWKKAFERFSKEATPEQATEKDLFQPIAPEKEHEFEKPTEDKFKVPSDEKKADVMIGVGREAYERTEATKEAGVLQADITEGLGKVAAQEKKADYEGWVNQETWAVALWLDNNEGLYNEVRQASSTIKDPLQFADWLESFIEAQKPDLGATLWDDMLTHSLANVKWYDIATHEMEKEASKLPKVEKKADTICPNRVDHHVGKKCPTCGIDETNISPLKREELPVEKQGCPVCGSMEGTDLANGQQDHMSCMACGITYGSNEIKSCASKADTLKKVAEIQSPWIVTTDANGQEVIARRDISELNKESKEDKTEELQK